MLSSVPDNLLTCYVEKLTILFLSTCLKTGKIQSCFLPPHVIPVSSLLFQLFPLVLIFFYCSCSLLPPLYFPTFSPTLLHFSCYYCSFYFITNSAYCTLTAEVGHSMVKYSSNAIIKYFYYTNFMDRKLLRTRRCDNPVGLDYIYIKKSILMTNRALAWIFIEHLSFILFSDLFKMYLL